MSELDWQFRELLIKALISLDFSVAQGLEELATANNMPLSTIVSLYADWRVANIEELAH